MEPADRPSQESTWRFKSPLDSHTAHSNPHSRPALPSIKMLDLEKIKREEAEYNARGSHIVSNVSSPSVSYPSGPPPPYSHPSFPAARTPPESRRSSGDDQSKPKQSLPSLHEALGVEQSTPYHSQTPYSSAAAQPVYHAVAPPSPPPARRSFAMEPPPPPPQAPVAHAPRSPYSQTHSNLSPRQMPDHAERQRSVYAHQPPPPPSAMQAAQSPLSHPSQYPRYSAPPLASPSQEPHSAHPVSVTQPRPLPYGYATAPAPAYPAPYAYTSAPPPVTATSSVYQPSVTQPAPIYPVEGRPQQFSESVKRHLDLWDFSEALNEIIDSSNYMLDFSRQYGARLHQSQRSDPAPGTLPQLQEIDHLMEKSRRQMDCYAKMREYIVAQQTAYLQQAQEQQYRAQDGIKRDSVHHQDSAKIDSFAGTEAKKRRGRAAPPGRCHSCNRAETPEWRRGPDGARTLCNACGLHYAKLTRKAGKSAAAAISSSNLRPKAPEEN